MFPFGKQVLLDRLLDHVFGTACACLPVPRFPDRRPEPDAAQLAAILEESKAADAALGPLDVRVFHKPKAQRRRP